MGTKGELRKEAKTSQEPRMHIAKIVTRLRPQTLLAEYIPVRAYFILFIHINLFSVNI